MFFEHNLSRAIFFKYKFMADCSRTTGWASELMYTQKVPCHLEKDNGNFVM